MDRDCLLKKSNIFYFRITITGWVRVKKKVKPHQGTYFIFYKMIFKGFYSWKYGLATIRFDLKYFVENCK